MYRSMSAGLSNSSEEDEENTQKDGVDVDADVEDRRCC